MAENAIKAADTAAEQAGAPLKKGVEPKHALWRWILFFVGIVGMVVIIIAVKPTDTLNENGVKALGILFLMVIWWIAGICSILVTSFTGISLMLLMNVAKVADVFSGFSDSTVVFLVFAFMIAAAVTKTGLGKRIAYGIMSRVKPKFGPVMLMLGILSIVLGALIPSGSARTVLVCTIALMLLPVFGQREDKPSNVGRSMFSLLALNGFMASTAYLTGGAGVILTVGLLADAGYPLDYLKYLLCCMPFVIVATVLLSVVIPRFIYKPEIAAVDMDKYKEFQGELKSLGPMSGQEKKAAIIIALVVLLWVIGGYFNLSFISVGVAGATLLMYPLLRVTNDKDFNSKVSWDGIYFVAVCMTMGKVLEATGVSPFLAELFSPILFSSNIVIFGLKVWLIATVVHFILPSALPALATFIPILIASANGMGFNPVVPVLIFSITYTGLLMPYQQVHAAIAYGFKQFTSEELMKPGFALILIWGLLTPLMTLYINLFF
jgi:anion transporter